SAYFNGVSRYAIIENSIGSTPLTRPACHITMPMKKGKMPTQILDTDNIKAIAL
ncbi:hypothetical protein MKW98_024616, partial [Papaver atlanticum]